MDKAAEKRFEILKGMNSIVKGFNHEGAYYDGWIWCIPDQADDEELKEIAYDMPEIFGEAVQAFGHIMKNEEYLEGGIYDGETVFEF